MYFLQRHGFSLAFRNGRSEGRRGGLLVHALGPTNRLRYGDEEVVCLFVKRREALQEDAPCTGARVSAVAPNDYEAARPMGGSNLLCQSTTHYPVLIEHLRAAKIGCRRDSSASAR
eukprot:1178343-Prorocentrum_minimum.AAC.3